MQFFAWLLSLIFAFSLGANSSVAPKETDSELRNRVQEHIDVIVNESAAIVDDVTESIREDERVQEAEKFVQDVKDVAQETADGLNQVMENTKNSLQEKFGTPDATDAPGAEQEPLPEKAPENSAPEGEESPAPDEPVNG